MGEKDEKKILGVWTKEEFMDDLTFSFLASMIGFMTGFLYRGMSRFLSETKWFKEEKK